MSQKTNTLHHIAISGNIGAGKTTLAGKLADYYKWTPEFEDADENPFITDFYDDMKRWSFHMQIYYLNRRFRQILRIRQESYPVVQDRSIYEDFHIFASNLREMKLMSKRDFDTYSSLFKTIESQVQPPDLLIYLKADIPTLVERIQKRGRPYEDTLRLNYLRKLNEHYERWIEEYVSKDKLLIIDASRLDFEANAEDLGEIIHSIDSFKSGILDT